MKRLRILSILVSLMLLLPVSAAAAELEGVYPDVCPINTAASLAIQADGTLLNLTAFNATDHPISYMEFSLYLFDADGAPASDGASNYFRAYAPDMHFAPLTEKTLSWSLQKFPSAAEIRDFRMEKVVFESGQEWHRPEALFSQAFMYAQNPKDALDRYHLDAGRTLTLVDYSYSSRSRVWYIWNDGPGWVPFSYDLVASCQVWAPGAAIKLEINGDPSLYQVQSFQVVPSPGSIAVNPYVTGQTAYLLPAETAYAAQSDAPHAAVGHPIETGLPIGDVPLMVGLWDYTESEGRTWSIWDGTAWVVFSYDRGPLCQIWRTGTIYIKLAYPGSEAVYALEVKGV